MLSLVNLFLNICLMRHGPERLPASQFLLGLVIAINAITSLTLTTMLNDTPLITSSTLVVVNLAGTALLTWGALSFVSHTPRFNQTFLAVVGVDLLLTLVMGVVLLLGLDANGDPRPFASTLWLMLTIWSLAVLSFIFHKAMEIHMLPATGVALFVMIFSVAVGQAAIDG